VSSRFVLELVTGFGPMDDQHRRLFELLEEAIGAARAASPEMSRKVRTLCDATREHFAFEERAMRDDLPSRDGHVAAHRAFAADLSGLRAAAEDGKAPLVAMWLDSRFASWFRLHTSASDRSLAAHLVAEGAASAAGPRASAGA
jgi:hemerythrin-like metal-binding protein